MHCRTFFLLFDQRSPISGLVLLLWSREADWFFSICISFTLDKISKYEWENSPFLIGRNIRQRAIFLQLVLRERKLALNSKFWPCTREVRDRIWALGNIQHVPGDSQALWDVGPKSLLALDVIALAVNVKTDSFLLICDGRQSLQALYHSRDFSNGIIANRSHFPETREPTEGFFYYKQAEYSASCALNPRFLCSFVGFNINALLYFTGITVCWGLHCCRISRAQGLLACVE